MLRVIERVDHLDLQKILELEGSLAWQMILRRIHSMIEEARHTCETATRIDDVRYAQGKLTALRRVKDLPNILRMEVRSQNEGK